MRALRLGVLLLCAGIASFLLAMRRGWVPMVPAAFAAAVGAFMLAGAVWLVAAVMAGVRRGRFPVTSAAEILTAAGLLTVAAGGMTNWLMGLQGTVILLEGEQTTLSKPSQLLAFDAGPLARRVEMGGFLQLLELKLVPAAGGFIPESRLRFVRSHATKPREIFLRPKAGAVDGSLRFYQGAFGFAPRIVILKGGEQLLDDHVPFQTLRVRPGVIRFDGQFDVAREGLHVEGAISLEGLDEEMKGHPKLGLLVRKGGQALGGGELLPGHFADIAEGYRIGFAGMKRWSEIDISRRNYPIPIFIGAAIALIGLLAWPVAAWRRW